MKLGPTTLGLARGLPIARGLGQEALVSPVVVVAEAPAEAPLALAPTRAPAHLSVAADVEHPLAQEVEGKPT